MPQPTSRDLYINRPLGDVSVAYQQQQADFVSDKVFRNVGVQVQGGLYYIYEKDDWFRSVAGVRGPSQESAGGGWEVSTDNYFCTVYAVHKDIDDQDVANADSQFNLDRDATLWVTQNMLLKREQVFQSTYLVPNVWGRDMQGVSGAPGADEFKQFDLAGSDPVRVIRTVNIQNQRANGVKLNTLVIGPSVLLAWENHSLILDRIKYTEKGIVTTDLLKALFRVDNIYVTEAINNLAPKGAAADFDFINDNTMLMCYVPPNPGLQTPAAGYTFSWNGLLGAQALGTSIARIPQPLLKSTRVEAEMAWQMKVVAPELGIFFSDVVSSV